jgi:hypothetical protein
MDSHPQQLFTQTTLPVHVNLQSDTERQCLVEQRTDSAVSPRDPALGSMVPTASVFSWSHVPASWGCVLAGNGSGGTAVESATGPADWDGECVLAVNSNPARHRIANSDTDQNFQRLIAIGTLPC